MECFIPALQHLSSGGMSEDESDHASEDESDQTQREDMDSRTHQSALKGRCYKIVRTEW